MTDPFEALRWLEELRYNMEYFGKFDLGELARHLAYDAAQQQLVNLLDGIVERAVEMHRAAQNLRNLVKEHTSG